MVKIFLIVTLWAPGMPGPIQLENSEQPDLAACLNGVAERMQNTELAQIWGRGLIVTAACQIRRNGAED